MVGDWFAEVIQNYKINLAAAPLVEGFAAPFVGGNENAHEAFVRQHIQGKIVGAEIAAGFEGSHFKIGDEFAGCGTNLKELPHGAGAHLFDRQA